jgi:hypothetical protein
LLQHSPPSLGLPPLSGRQSDIDVDVTALALEKALSTLFERQPVTFHDRTSATRSRPA